MRTGWGATPLRLPVRCGGRTARRRGRSTGLDSAALTVDVGANTGHSTLWFAHRFPGARIVAVEPDPHAARALRCNVAGLPGVEVRELAVGARAGAVALHTSPDSWASSLLPSAWAEWDVVRDALPGFRAEIRWPPPHRPSWAIRD